MQAARLSLSFEEQLKKSLALLAADAEWLALQQVLNKILSSGHEVYLAGGCVRDLLLGRKPKDFDLASSALPEEIENLFPKTVAVGKQFGIIVVVQDGFEIEVARFRTEGKYQDGRHPGEVVFATAAEDASRRDFTVNALFLSLSPIRVYDVVGGIEDLSLKLLRAVGDPKLRFAEDHLRILRALRFVSELEFQLDDSLLRAVCEQASLARQVSPERFFEEWSKLLMASGNLNVLKLIQENDLMCEFFPDLQWDRKVFERILNLNMGKSFNWPCLWLWAFLSGSSKESLQKTWQELRSAKVWMQDMNAALEWFFHPLSEPFGLGEVMQRIFTRKSSLLGFELWICWTESQTKPWYLELCELRVFWGERLPEPWVRGGDLSDLYAGGELGQRLQKIYRAQLERRVTDPKEAIRLARTSNFA